MKMGNRKKHLDLNIVAKPPFFFGSSMLILGVCSSAWCIIGTSRCCNRVQGFRIHNLETLVLSFKKKGCQMDGFHRLEGPSRIELLSKLIQNPRLKEPLETENTFSFWSMFTFPFQFERSQYEQSAQKSFSFIHFHSEFMFRFVSFLVFKYWRIQRTFHSNRLPQKFVCFFIVTKSGAFPNISKYIVS